MIRRKRFKVPPILTVLGEGTEIQGDLTFRAGMHVDGKVEGRITGIAGTRPTLVVSQSGHIKGDVHVENLILDGRIEGDVFACGRVELAPGARVSGKVHYQFLAMAMGAEVNGQLIHDEDLEKQCNEASKEEPKTPHSEDDRPDSKEHQ